MTPVVTKATVSGSPANMITFEGTGFTSQVPSGMTVFSYYRGVKGTATSTTDTLVEVAFTDGVPVPLNADSIKPTLVFEDSTEAYTAYMDGSVFENAPVFAINDIPSELECSFAGGCDYIITAPGLAGALEGTEDSSIEVCGNTCMFDAEKSDAS
jgi:hypothetical protein